MQVRKEKHYMQGTSWLFHESFDRSKHKTAVKKAHDGSHETAMN